jgi:hypothetical protein
MRSRRSPRGHALEHRDWKTAVSLVPMPASYPWDKFPYQLAISSSRTPWARRVPATSPELARP